MVDGEIVIEVDGKLSFEALQMRLHPAESRIRKLASATPARLILYDVLVEPGGQCLLNEPLVRRRTVLEKFIAGVNRTDLIISRATRDVTEANHWLSDAGHGSTDGIVAKLLAHPYRPGKRAMIKVKRLRTADCVVGGFRYLSDSRQVGSLLLGLYNDAGQLDHVGFTSTIANDERGA